MLYDSDETDGQFYQNLNAGNMKVENSTTSGCTITLTNAYNINVEEYYFNGTVDLTF